MAGVYVHIPFCRSKCYYCDFYSLPRLEFSERYCRALVSEARLLRCGRATLWRTVNWRGDARTMYVGGGTPSALPPPMLATLIGDLRKALGLRELDELTVEINPDDATPQLMECLVAAGVDRLSMGVQSFNDAILRSVGRRHNCQQAVDAVAMAREAGIDNVSIDLIYGLPGETLASWQSTLERAVALGVQHISAYCLNYEPGTRLWAMRQAGKVTPVEDEACVAMYEALVAALRAAGFVHYEISNFALPGSQSLHNSAYWSLAPYVGLGAAAHSFSGRQRMANPANLMQYLETIERGELAHSIETLTPNERHDEAIMLALRTSRGLDIVEFERLFGKAAAERFERRAKERVEQKLMKRKGLCYSLSESAIMTSDNIISDFFA